MKSLYADQLELPMPDLGARPPDAAVKTTVTGYLSRMMLHPENFVHRVRLAVKRYHLEDCDTIIGSGLSGAIGCALLGPALGLKWAVVRKHNDGTHSEYAVEGQIGQRWLFLDDLISSGETMRRVYRAVLKHCEPYEISPKRTRPAHVTTFHGALLYMNLGRFLSASACLTHYNLAPPVEDEPLVSELPETKDVYESLNVTTLSATVNVGNKYKFEDYFSAPVDELTPVTDNAIISAEGWPLIEVMPAMTAQEIRDKLTLRNVQSGVNALRQLESSGAITRKLWRAREDLTNAALARYAARPLIAAKVERFYDSTFSTLNGNRFEPPPISPFTPPGS